LVNGRDAYRCYTIGGSQLDTNIDQHNGAIFWWPKIAGIGKSGWIYTWYTYCHDYLRSDKITDKIHWCINGVQLEENGKTEFCPTEGKWKPIDVFAVEPDLDTGFLLNGYCLRNWVKK